MDESVVLEQLAAALDAHASAQFDRAESLCQSVLECAPARPEALTLMGMIRRRHNRFDEAEHYYRQALAAAPHYADAHHNLGNLLLDLGQAESALACFQRSSALRPEWAEGHNRIGATLHALGRLDEALPHFERALALRPDAADIHWDYALALLAAGRYTEGWREYEWRWARRQPAPRDLPQPAWTGQDLQGKRLLVYVEQGYGDAIQCMRFLPLLKARGAHLVLELHAPLQALADAALGVDETVIMGEALPDFDYHVSIMSLPGLLGATLETLPRAVPYLRVRADRLKAWRPRLSTAAGEALKVGIVWAGNPNVKNDRWRSPRLAPLLPLLSLPGIRFFALQKGDGSRDIATAGAPASLTDLGPDIQDFADTAAILLELDLVISTDTSVAHLAGALGRPVWLMLHASPDWRWQNAGRDNAWYPTARLYRQRTLGDWSGVVAELDRDLRALAGAPAADAVEALRRRFDACPLCDSRASETAGEHDCRRHALWHEPLPATLAWRRCLSCGHVYTDGYYTERGLREVFARAHDSQLAGGDFDTQRFVWSRVVEQVLKHLPAGERLFHGGCSWLDVGCGAGGLVFTAAEYGFDAMGLDARQSAAERLSALGYRAQRGDLMDAPLKRGWSVISMADVLEHMPDPRAALRRVRELLADDGALFLSCPNADCAAWRGMDASATNPYWQEIEHVHNFSRARLMSLLRECGFEPVAYGVSQRYKACMEIVARPVARTGPTT